MDYCMVKNFGGQNFGENASLKHWRIWRLLYAFNHKFRIPSCILKTIFNGCWLPRVGGIAVGAVIFSFAVNSMICGYHEYKSVWESQAVDDDLLCEREVGNPHDTHAVAIKKDIAGEITTVGHIP